LLAGPTSAKRIGMGCLGVHFALTATEVAKLRAFENDADRRDYLMEEIEEDYFSNHEAFTAQSDKAWDAMHRSLSDGQLSYTSGPYPERLAVIGGEPLYFEGDYIMSLKTPAEVKAVAEALARITEEDFRRRYDAMDAVAYGCPKSDEDFDYTWEWFGGVVALFQQAAKHGRYVLFTADQ
jgi:hypothetical protein